MAGLMVANIIVLELPPKISISILKAMEQSELTTRRQEKEKGAVPMPAGNRICSPFKIYLKLRPALVPLL